MTWRVVRLDSSQCKTFLSKRYVRRVNWIAGHWASPLLFAAMWSSCWAVKLLFQHVWERALRQRLEIALSTSFLLKFASLQAWSWREFRLLGRTLFLRALLSRFGSSLSQHVLKVCISASHQTGKETRLLQRRWMLKEKNNYRFCC